MDNFLVPSDPKYFSSVCRQISKKSRSTWNRLLSIFCDAQFVQHLTQTIKLPIIANLRCGVWYCQDYIDQCYFKSTDGHQGQWSFSLSRLNLHLLEVVASNGGGIIVDATRKGKLFPDALSKTIPIWIAVMNQVLGLDSEFILYEGISESEFYCIQERLNQWKDEFLELRLDLCSLKHKMKKPMRPFWISQDSMELNFEFPKGIHQFPYYSIVLVSCSSNSKLTPFSEGLTQTHSFDYVPGAADDEESWSMGLTPDLFWKHHKELIAQGPVDLEDNIRSIMSSRLASIIQQRFGFVLKTNEILEYDSSLILDSEVAWLNCGLRNASMDAETQVWIPIPHQKSQKTGLISHLPRILFFSSGVLDKDHTLLIYDLENREVAFCVVLALVIAYYQFEDDGRVTYSNNSQNQVTKQSIKKTIGSLSSLLNFHCPSRALLKQIFNFFYKGNLFGIKS